MTFNPIIQYTFYFKYKILSCQRLLLFTQSYPILCNPMDCSTPGFFALHQLSGLAQTHVHWIRNAIQPPHPLLLPSPPALNLSQHEGLFQWVSSLHQVAKVWELQLHRQSFQWTFRVDFFGCCSVAKSCSTVHDPMDYSMPDSPVPHHLPESAQVHVHWIGDAIQPSHPLLLSSSAFSLSQHQGLFQWIGSLPQVAKVLELQLQLLQV